MLSAFATLYIYGKRAQAALVVLTAIGAQASIELVKTLLNRTRPGTEIELASTLDRRFPSGHTGETTAIILMIAFMIASLDVKREIKLISLAIALVVSFFVGISRLYLGAHWPMDVVAGWLLALSWALLASLILERLNPTASLHTKQPALHTASCKA